MSKIIIALQYPKSLIDNTLLIWHYFRIPLIMIIKYKSKT